MAREYRLFYLVIKRALSFLLFAPPENKASRQKSRLGRSVFIRQVDGGSSNAAELEIAALFGPSYDIERYGFQLVSSPRHADVLLLTGPLVKNMEEAVLAAFKAMPKPRKVITVGDFGGENGLFKNSYAVVQQLPDEIAKAVIANIPGDPPSPQEILEVLLQYL